VLRIGHGWDAHRLVPGRRCVIGGIEVESDVGPEGHSDGDAVLHALADAILGATATGDLGSVFGTADPVFADAPSSRFVEIALERAGRPRVQNADVTIVAQRPRLAPHVGVIRERVASLLGVPVSAVSVKASSGNGLTDFGRGEGIAATVVLLLDDGS
jgi:2-C-methyl-D-erythritol 2,4-cyclodiphosphate synthase